MPHRVRRGRGDSGAAAVEFALLFPIFAALTLGTVTVGTAFFRDIAITNATREAARFGSTLQIADPAVTGSVTRDQWLVQVAQIAIRSGGWSLPSNLATVNPTLPDRDGNGSADPLSDNGFVCVAYVAGTEGLLIPTGSLTFKSGQAVGTFTATPCVTPDGVSVGSYDPKRVQVVIQRNAMLEVLSDDSGFLLLDSQSVITYERGDT